MHTRTPFLTRLHLSAAALAVVLGAVVGACAMSRAPEATDPPPVTRPATSLAPLAFLAGHCWQGTFPDGEHVDTRCAEFFYDDAFLRDRHLVRGPSPDYRGETIYHVDPERGVVTYRYWSSPGAVSNGDMHLDGDDLVFPGERHVGEDGTITEIRSLIRPLAEDRYLSVTEKRTESGWEEMWTIEFTRLEGSSAEGPDGRLQADKLAVFEPLIGHWAAPPDPDATDDPPDVQQSFQWGPRRMLVRVLEGLSVPFADGAHDPVLEGIVFYDHAEGDYPFHASTRFGWTFAGRYRVMANNKLERVYEVHYAENEPWMPVPELGGQVRRYREIYTFLDPDHLSIQLDIWRDGDWQPFGPGTYELLRLEGGLEG